MSQSAYTFFTASQTEAGAAAIVITLARGRSASRRPVSGDEKMAACFGVLLLVSLVAPPLAQPHSKSRRRTRRMDVPLKEGSIKMCLVQRLEQPL
jgi:hypothetical protein